MKIETAKVGVLRVVPSTPHETGSKTVDAYWRLK